MSLRILIDELEKVPAGDDRFPNQVHRIKRRKKEGADAWKVRLLITLKDRANKEEKENFNFLNKLPEETINVLTAEVKDLAPYTVQFEYPKAMRVKMHDSAVETESTHDLRAAMSIWVGQSYTSKIAEAQTCDLMCLVCPTSIMVNCAFQNKSAREKDGVKG